MLKQIGTVDQRVEPSPIRQLRERMGLSQEKFAQLLRVSLQSVRRWESGVSKPHPALRVRLAALERDATAQAHRFGGIRMRAPRSRNDAGTEVGLGGLFKGIGSLLDVVSMMAERGEGATAGSGELTALAGKLRGVYGFSVRTGLGGKPIIEQFGNIRETEAGAVVAETREPLVDVLDEGDGVVVIVELPGVEEKDIQLEVHGDVLELAASTGDRRYEKEVLLPCAVDRKSLKSCYRNGVLEVRLAKRRAAV